MQTVGVSDAFIRADLTSRKIPDGVLEDAFNELALTSPRFHRFNAPL